MAPTHVHLAEDVWPLSEFRANAADFIQQLREKKRALVLTQRGRTAAVVLDVSEYEKLLDEIETLRDIKTATQQIAAGQGVEHSKARRRVHRRLRS